MKVEVDTNLIQEAKKFVGSPQTPKEVVKEAIEYFIKSKSGRPRTSSDINTMLAKLATIPSGEEFSAICLHPDWEDINTDGKRGLGTELSEMEKGSKDFIKTHKTSCNLQIYKKL
ncbi:hypothetical protein [Rosenbergiella epipactidis]|uniref:hypothetical protein n=1 Tax=Rosenbergiella epipactidis TaxID=1544694 RepID=UPI001F4F7155|nr:hypothetical protein [Rosenbergiella epipactidis]